MTKEVKIKGDSAMSSPVVRGTNVFKRKSMRFVAALLALLASFVGGPNAALDAAPQHRDQAPGFYRLKVGDLEVTALFDGTAAFDPHWLNGTRATMDGVAKALHEDPHMLEVADTGFLVNTGKQLILVDAGAGTWWGGEAFGRLASSLSSAGYTPKDAQPFFQSAQAIAAPYIKAGKWHTFGGSETIVDGMQLVPLPGHTPGHTGYEFSSKGQKILFWGDIIHAQRVQLQHPEVTVGFDIDPTMAAASRNQLLSNLAREDVVIAGPHMLFPSMGRLHKVGRGYSWTPVQFTDQWVDHAPALQK